MSKFAIVKDGKLIEVAEHGGEALSLQQKHGGIIIEGEYSPNAAKSYIMMQVAQERGIPCVQLTVTQPDPCDLLGVPRGWDRIESD